MSELHTGNTSLPEKTREIMRALCAQHGDAFQTRYFQRDEASSESLVWREAWHNPHSGGWEVTEHTSAPNFYPGKEGGVSERRATLHTNLCFFDALYHCALFEASEERFGRVPAVKPIPAQQMHYSDFAAREGIPLDQAGMPLVAAYGRILSDGDYDEKAREIAANSPKKLDLAKAVPAAPALSSFNNINLPVPVKQELTAASQHDLVRLQHMAQELTDKIKAVEKSLDRCREKKFVICSGYDFLWLNLIPVVGTIVLLMCASDLPNDFPRYQFNRSLRNLRGTFNKVAAVTDVAPFRQFADDAELTYQIMRARQVTRGYVNRENREGTMNRCLRAFRMTAKKQGWDENSIAAMEKNIGHNVNNSSFDSELQDRLTVSAAKLKSSLSSLGN